MIPTCFVAAVNVAREIQSACAADTTSLARGDGVAGQVLALLEALQRGEALDTFRRRTLSEHFSDTTTVEFLDLLDLGDVPQLLCAVQSQATERNIHVGVEERLESHPQLPAGFDKLIGMEHPRASISPTPLKLEVVCPQKQLGHVCPGN